MVSTKGLLSHGGPQHSLSRFSKDNVGDNLFKGRVYGGRVQRNRKRASLKYPELKVYSGSIRSSDSLKTTELSRSINATHQEIVQDAIQSLTLREQATRKHLAKVVSLDTAKLSSQSIHHSELFPFHYDFANRDEDRARDFRETSEVEKKLNSLWKEWVKTQRKITCLGIEVMGIEHFGGLRSKGSGISKERLNTVASASREQQKAEADFNSVLQIQGEEVQGVTREAISSSKVQGKKLRDETRKLGEEMRQLAQKMVVGS